MTAHSASPATPAAPAAPRKNPLLATLCTQYAVLAEGRPLALGIHKVLLARQPELDPAQLRVALKIHTASTRYLKALVAATSRFGLDGQPDGEVTDEQRAAAEAMLKERFAKVAERRRAEAKAQATAARDAQAAEARQAKLEALAAKFKGR